MRNIKLSALFICALTMIVAGLPADRADAQTYKRFTMRVGGNLELPSGDFSQTRIGTGGYADTGAGYEFGMLFRLANELYIIGEHQRHFFEVYEELLTFDSGVSITDASWDVEHFGLGIRGSFGDYDDVQMWLQGTTGWYRGYYSESGDSTSASYTSEWNMGVSAGAGLLFPVHRLLVIEAGMRVHTLTLRFDTMFDKPVLWLSVGTALHVAIW
ncbi:MAG: hypothetical protein R6W82_06015 [bacterium]